MAIVGDADAAANAVGSALKEIEQPSPHYILVQREQIQQQQHCVINERVQRLLILCVWMASVWKASQSTLVPDCAVSKDSRCVAFENGDLRCRSEMDCD